MGIEKMKLTRRHVYRLQYKLNDHLSSAGFSPYGDLHKDLVLTCHYEGFSPLYALELKDDLLRSLSYGIK